jgi:PKD repeat protein
MREGSWKGAGRRVAIAIAVAAALAVLPSSDFASAAHTPSGLLQGPGFDPFVPTGATEPGIEPYSRNPTETRPFALCPPPTKRRASCLAAVVPTEGGEPVAGPAAEGTGMLGGLSPADLRSAYGISGGGGTGQTIAITIAFDNPNAEQDLAVYRSAYGLAPCTSADGCFRKVNQRGEPGSYPVPNEEWALETSLDLDMASAICPGCRLLLVEADSNEAGDMAAAVETAAAMGATVISNSWAGEEFAGQSEANEAFRHPGVPTLFASGDWGYGVYYPSSSPDVIAVGGTSLEQAANSRGWTEKAWSGAGSGCSRFEAKPAWQHDGGCARRTVADISAVSDTDTPVSAYDSFGKGGWVLLGGTSVATPIIAGVEALSSPEARAGGPEAIARVGEAGLLNDVTEGENGICAGYGQTGLDAAYLCQSDDGYDGPTGWGTPRGPLSVPRAVTRAASMQSPDEALLRGALDPGGSPATYRFQYGKTASYGASVPVPEAAAGSGSGFVEVEQAVAGLEPRTVYHFRIVATDGTATWRGEDRTFATTPPAVETGDAVDVGTLTATVQGTVDPEGSAARYHFEFGTGPGYTRKAPIRSGRIAAGDTPVPVSAQLDSLRPATLYHYRAVAVNGAGTTYGPDRVFVTEAAAWFATTMPQPTNSGDGHEAAAVSCVARSSCVAVGDNWSMDLHTAVTLAERWDGRDWTPMPTPNPPGLEEGWADQRMATLLDVECVADGKCLAIGYYRDLEGLKPLAELLEGGEWTIVSPPRPAAAVGAVLEGLSCVSIGDCVAVGNVRFQPNVPKPLAFHWDGDDWAVEPTPDPPTGETGWLAAVSCPQSGVCMAVGGRRPESGAPRTFAARLDEGSWAVEAAPNPSGTENWLEDVSCPGAGVCTAVGRHFEKPGTETIQYPLAVRWVEDGWVVQTIPKVVGASSGLTGVSCVAADACTAVGAISQAAPWGTSTEILGERWDGVGWKRLPMIGLGDPDGWWHDRWLLGVSCPEADACTSVGYGLSAPIGQLSPRRALAEHEVKPVVARFTAAPAQLETGDRVDFDATLSEADLPIKSYVWEFGDGERLIGGAKPSHVYTAPGRFAVKLTVVDDAGREAQAGMMITVDSIPPSAVYSVITPTPTAGQPTHFDATASDDADGTIESYEWSFDDGTGGVGAEVSHTFLAAGDYTVALVVTDDEGRSAEFERLVSVSNPPPPEIPVTIPVPGPVGQPEAPPIGSPDPGPAFSVSGADVDRGRIVLRLLASGAGTFDAQARRFGSASARAVPRRVTRLTLLPGKRARRALRRHGRIRTTVSIVLRGEGGGRAAESLDLTVNAARRARKG